MIRQVKRTFYFIGHILFGFMALGALYLLLAFVLGLLSVNNQYDVDRGSIEIFLIEKGGHASIALPTQSDQINWTTVFSPQNTLDPVTAELQPYVLIGWGSKTFYTKVQRWKKLKPSTAIQSLLFDRGALNITYINTPETHSKSRSIKITQTQYEAIIAQINSELSLQNGQPRVIDGTHNEENKTDAFYDSRSFYTPWKTCNQWTRNLLSKAKITMPLWAPFSQTLFWHI